MDHIRRIACLSIFLLGPSLAAAPLPQLFQKVKEQFRLAAYADAVGTLAQVETEVQKPENQGYRASLRPSLAFYRGACLAALGRDQEAREEFEVFLTLSPNAS